MAPPAPPCLFLGRVVKGTHQSRAVSLSRLHAAQPGGTCFAKTHVPRSTGIGVAEVCPCTRGSGCKSFLSRVCTRLASQVFVASGWLTPPLPGRLPIAASHNSASPRGAGIVAPRVCRSSDSAPCVRRGPTVRACATPDLLALVPFDDTGLKSPTCDSRAMLCLSFAPTRIASAK